MVILKLKNKNSTNIKDLFQKIHIDINKIVVSYGKKGFKYLIGCKDAKIRPLCIFIPKMSAYRRNIDETKYISFLIKDNELLEKDNEIWEKVSKKIKKRT